MSMKNCNATIVNRTRGLPTCSTEPQQTACPTTYLYSQAKLNKQSSKIATCFGFCHHHHHHPHGRQHYRPKHTASRRCLSYAHIAIFRISLSTHSFWCHNSHAGIDVVGSAVGSGPPYCHRCLAFKNQAQVYKIYLYINWNWPRNKFLDYWLI
jgi:hypothetical protein